MKKILLILIFTLFFNNISFSTTNTNPASIKPYCKNAINQKYIGSLDKLKIEKIEIDIDSYKKWTRNSLKILIGNFRFIPEKFKRRFDADLTVKFENNLKCSFKARIRHSGDQKDHISLKKNSIIQSVDVHLKTGHIYGITKFKLLRPNTRGNFKDEIFLTELLREFKYLAPRTYYVDAKINEVESKMLFQEKAAKELLEYNLRREGPIFEGDEKFIWTMTEKTPSTQLSNHAAGIVPLMKLGFNAMLAKQNNSKIITKSEKHALMSFDSLSNLNLSYLLYNYMYNISKIKYYETYRYYTLNNDLLGFHNHEKILKLDIYNLLMQSANGYHGMVPNNRKFYWNSLENIFEPINYDSNYNINQDPEHLLLPVSNQLIDAFSKLEILLSNININKLNDELNFKGININIKEIVKKIEKLKKNSNKLKNIYLNYDKDIIKHNGINKIDTQMWVKYFNSVKKIHPNSKLVKQKNINNSFQVCGTFLDCKDKKFSNEEIIKLLNGNLTINGIEHQYLGKNTNVKDLVNSSNYNSINFKDSNFYFDKNITYNFDKKTNVFDIFQNSPGSRAFFYKGTLKNITINFYGYENQIIGTPSNFPADQRGLTGCISLIKLNIINVNIKSNNSSCEDAINLINVKGSIDEIDVKDSYSDGLDVDFSNLSIKNIKINTSGNDCVDFSAGNYKLNRLNLANCGDKALSIGEKSILELNKINVDKADTGIAVKDSSNVTAQYLDIKKTIKCIDVYRKKQEFSGAKFSFKFANCHDSKINKQEGSFIN